MKYHTRSLRDGWHFKRGDIYLVNLNPFRGSEQGGTRPVLVLQNNIGNRHAPTLIISPITTQLRKLHQPTHLMLRREGGLYRDSMLFAEQIQTIDKSRILGYIGKLSPETMTKADAAVAYSLGLRAYEEYMEETYASQTC